MTKAEMEGLLRGVTPGANFQRNVWQVCDSFWRLNGGSKKDGLSDKKWSGRNKVFDLRLMIQASNSPLWLLDSFSLTRSRHMTKRQFFF